MPFQILTTQALDAVVATTDNPSFAALATESDLRSSTIAAIELLLIDVDKPLSADARKAVASMVLRHLSTSGLLSPRDVMRFAVRNSAKLAERLRTQPHLIAAETDLSHLLA
ncbi:MAG: hypothetical protein K2Y42_00340 [Hyphomicrobium sp.]|uniref:hypothetical protein n=1 Tax=Hyphomicrobium sp. TaxID=82 RepID=UPI0025BC0E06|nr:hypothetical protein [Hyphomicrobium sp.]MBX9861172.1 hypothetical protein [Hyphomicrobium sp.]